MATARVITAIQNIAEAIRKAGLKTQNEKVAVHIGQPPVGFSRASGPTVFIDYSGSDEDGDFTSDSNAATVRIEISAYVGGNVTGGVARISDRENALQLLSDAILALKSQEASLVSGFKAEDIDLTFDPQELIWRRSTTWSLAIIYWQPRLH